MASVSVKGGPEFYDHPLARHAQDERAPHVHALPEVLELPPTIVHLSVQHLVQFVEEVASQDDVAESAVSPVVVELVLSQILIEFKIVSDGLLGLLRAERVGGGE